MGLVQGVQGPLSLIAQTSLVTMLPVPSTITRLCVAIIRKQQSVGR